jgi:hypothetical protein
VWDVCVDGVSAGIGGINEVVGGYSMWLGGLWESTISQERRWRLDGCMCEMPSTSVARKLEVGEICVV